MQIKIPLLEMRRPRRRRRVMKVPAYAPPAPPTEVLVVSVVGIAGGDVVVTFSAPVTLVAELPTAGAIWFEEEGGGRGGYVSEMEQAAGAADAIVMRVDGLPLSSGCTWSIVATPENLVVDGGSIVVPQGGAVE